MREAQLFYAINIRMGWFALSVIAGILSGIGMILARGALGGMPPYFFLGVIGVVWFAGAGAQIIVRGGSVWQFGGNVLLIAVVASIFFLGENLLRYRAITMAPLIAYTFMTIALATMLVTLGYDLVQMYRAGTLATISYYSLAALILSVVALVLFQLAPKQ